MSKPLTEAQIRTLQRARETLTTVQTLLQSCTSRDFDAGRIVQACANAEFALFEVINLVETLAQIEAHLADVDLS